jgi:hypothetical protein
MLHQDNRSEDLATMIRPIAVAFSFPGWERIGGWV